MNVLFNRKQYLFAAVAAIITLLVVPAPFLDSQRYSAYAAAIQAMGILIAAILALATLNADRHDKQVDRVLTLHSEFVTGEVQQARIRLIDHLRSRGDGRYVLGVTRDDLQKNPHLSSYDGDSEHTPFHDANIVLRFFERANAAIQAKSVYEPLFHQLIIRHALWWEHVLLPSSTPWAGSVALDELAAWGHRYEQDHGANLEYLNTWGASRERDFGGRPGVHPYEPQG